MLAGIAAIVVAASAPAAPGPHAPIPRDPAALARVLVSTKTELAREIDAWRARAESRTPDEVTLDALYDQRIELLLAERQGLARSTLQRVSPGVAAVVRTNLIAKRELWRLTPRTRRRRFRTGPALPPATLLGYYREGQRRFGVPWNLLAAVNFVESAFNKLRNESATGAQGPMQFMPATWRAYGLGGDVRDPRDAVMGAANYLHANGAPADDAGALYHYNPSPLYVRAVMRYAGLIARDRAALPLLYAFQVYAGGRRLTGPGLP